jgi:hypothetical protein
LRDLATQALPTARLENQTPQRCLLRQRPQLQPRLSAHPSRPRQRRQFRTAPAQQRRAGKARSRAPALRRRPTSRSGGRCSRPVGWQTRRPSGTIGQG